MSEHPYLPQTGNDIKRMLSTCGVSTVDELFDGIDPSLRLQRPYNLPREQSEIEIRRFFAGLDRRNRTLTCFAGAGFYDHYQPAVVPSILARSEFLTAYTPYQPEISQGTLQYIFEYQTMMARLTGMEVSNASMYDGATSTAEAMMMTVAAARRRRRVLVSATLNPMTAQVLDTYAHYHGIALEVIPEKDGVTDRESLREMLGAGDVAGVVVAQPNYYGIIEDFSGLADECHAHKTLLVMNCQASPLAVLRTPGEWGADIAAGDAQSLGMPLNFGGPYLGYLTTSKALMRKMPGRIVGATKGKDDQRMFVLTLQAREQHIRREKATSNICSNQGLMALHTAVYMALMGSDGLRQVNELSYGGAHYLAAKMQATGRMSVTWPDQPFYNEVTMTLADPLTADRVIKACKEQGILAGVKLDDSHLIIAVTEMQTREDIDRYVEIVKSL